MSAVYVVAWEYGHPETPGGPLVGGGGFDWYFDEASADLGFVREMQNCDDPELAKDNWTAGLYAVEVEATPVPGGGHDHPAHRAITEEIRRQESELFDKATVRYRSKHAPEAV